MSKKLDETFRDSIGTIDDQGHRKFIFPKKPSGKLYEYRKWVSYFLLIILVANPFLKVNGNQFMMFNVLERRFNIFGFPFWPQDFYLFVLFMIVGVVFVILFTVIFGRIFCGWICPQTIFLEMVFRRIEYWIEGDRGAQIRLSKQEWNPEKIRKKALKWTIFLVISFFIANVFLAYLISSDELFKMIKEGPENHVSTLISLLIFTGVFYFVFAWFREQVCIIACPYGRLQGVLLDNKSINVAYDFVRGEKEIGRAKFNKKEERETTGKGDCIDCFQCVNVCPTGIDIRNGTQLECINCTACIDECDSIMKSIGLPKGLIRYASEDEIEKKAKFKFSNRMKGYTAVLAILIGILTGLLFLRNEVETVILRLPGQLYEHKGDNISNIFTFKIINKTNDDFNDIHFKLHNIKGTIKVVGKQSFKVKKQAINKGTLFVEINQFLLENDKTKIEVEIYNGNKKIETTTTSFLSPRSFD
ncbi:cytochrome c oxidase accessory protein CcoG [Flavobacterium psychrophilum]|uniref:cytochrome c oxidase accessory protein CcoG n=1 Tax=Flavobacterium psychrophilum TaxID=96345 RepID=UPI000A3D47CF|nr:cytochrome c oxidase accessory protein CcoG [Flavobacterium psychrophilum]EKT4499016.1 cytochrome c oxidase accessory protein CcoG [Flavobacterium psychrophilum]EKT4502042.1 cytochrome c oxidase accessory protein CcoG [Flavobacterium psychrophilum]EKT4549830.1 cytochrome c oxidase accessory protein CcoG [Flavobacterium psychrophilum]ELI6454494.1 cytochrome c oxidase accessory protein CcoG [Flavobacterium psychrophilum]ELM3644239.1 cytochrome c oxidase accessory protein CcoG [Flavobacterium 